MSVAWKPMHTYFYTLPMHPDGDYFSCAIRVSMCLHNQGAFNKAMYKKSGRKVSPHGWAMVAEELYQWLRHHGLGAAEQIPITLDDQTNLPQRNGIVYLRDCFVRSTDKSAEAKTGDHIDLYADGEGMLSAVRWPTEFPDGPFGLVAGCRDGKARFWTIK